MQEKFNLSLADVPFKDYGEYMEYLFACVNVAMNRHLEQMKRVFATGQGGYKNVLYPDLEVAADVCTERIERFRYMDEDENNASDEDAVDLPDELLSLFGNFAEEAVLESAETDIEIMLPENMMDLIDQRAQKTLDAGIALPFYE